MAKKKMDVVGDAVQKADDFLMGLCRPNLMTPAQAKDFLENVIERCRTSIEALVEENPELRE